MEQNNSKKLIMPIIAIFMFALLVFTAGYAYFNSSILNASATYQVNLPKQTVLTCTKTDCSINVSITQMGSGSYNTTTPKGTSTCYLNCTCSGSAGAVCSYNVRLMEMGTVYTPSSGLGSGKEYTVKITSPTGCTAQNASSTETQVNTMRDKTVSSCTLNVPSSGSVSANVAAEFKWYNLNLDQNAHAGKTYEYYLTNDNQPYTVTYDSNGGSVSPTTKQVVYGETYGPLATPNKSGSSFKGWNGKNKFDISDFVSFYAPYQSTPGSQTTFDGYDVWKIYGGVNATGRGLHYMEGKFKANTQYTISFDEYEVWAYSGANAYTGLVLYLNYTDGTQTLTGSSRDKWTSVKYTTPAGKSLLYFTVSYGTGNSYTYFKNFQVEEGTSKTLYEPYLVTSSTRVSQNKNHTLTAIWN